MPGISLVTKGMLAPPTDVSIIAQSGSGGAGLVRKDEELPKPLIKVHKVDISEGSTPLSNESIKVKSVKLLIE